jgi:hypothetical protein
MAGEKRVHDLGQDRVLVADDPGEERAARGEPGEEVRADLVAHGPAPERRLGPGAVLEVTKGAWQSHVGRCSESE